MLHGSSKALSRLIYFIKKYGILTNGRKSHSLHFIYKMKGSEDWQKNILSASRRMPGIISIFAIIGFIIIHLSSKYFSFHSFSLRKFLSFSGGVAVTYVLIHLWPTLSHAQHVGVETFNWESGILAQYFIYLIALAGLITFYALNRLIYQAWAKPYIKNPDDENSMVFRLHIGFFTVYNAMIGYLVASSSFDSVQSLVIYFIAYALHFVTNDWGLRHHLKDSYDRFGRYFLSIGVLSGWLIGYFTDFPEMSIGVIEAFVTGAMTYLAIKEELPAGEEGSLSGFLLGTISATALFVLL